MPFTPLVCARDTRNCRNRSEVLTFNAGQARAAEQKTASAADLVPSADDMGMLMQSDMDGPKGRGGGGGVPMHA